MVGKNDGKDEPVTQSASISKKYCPLRSRLIAAIFVLPPFLNSLSVQKYLSPKWIKRDVFRTKIRLDISPFIHFDDKYFRTEEVYVFKRF